MKICVNPILFFIRVKYKTAANAKKYNNIHENIVEIPTINFNYLCKFGQSTIVLFHRQNTSTQL